jgi:hypothetical protein
MRMSLKKKAEEVLQDSEGLVLLPGGIFIRKQHQKHGLYRYSDISTVAASFLVESVRVHPDFTINDLFTLLKNNLEDFIPIYRRNCFVEILEYFDEIKNGVIVNFDDDSNRVEAVELYWSLSAQRGECSLDKEAREEIEQEARRPRPRKIKSPEENGRESDLLEQWAKDRKEQIRGELSNGIYWENVKKDRHLTGMSFPMCHIWSKEGGKGRIKPFSMSFVGLERLLGAKLWLSDEALVVHEEKKYRTRGGIIKYHNPSYSLGQILQGFLWELSWHGTPAKTQARRKELFKVLKKVKEREKSKKTIPQKNRR